MDPIFPNGYEGQFYLLFIRSLTSCNDFMKQEFSRCKAQDGRNHRSTSGLIAIDTSFEHPVTLLSHLIKAIASQCDQMLQDLVPLIYYKQNQSHSSRVQTNYGQPYPSSSSCFSWTCNYCLNFL